MNHGNLDVLTGKLFGKLRVLDEYKSKKYKNGTQVYWLCECICGARKFVSSSKLKNGWTKSCGCYRRSFRKTGQSAMRTVFNDYIRNASRRGYLFELTEQQFLDITSSDCYFCGCPPSNVRQSKRKSDTFMHNGIDRLDNNTGYTLENSVACCKTCNRAKSTMSEEEFLQLIRKIYKRHFDK